jgi:hypothetical protein
MSDTAPLATYRYTLTWRDALAYERLPRNMPGLQKATLYIWMAFAGLLLIALPPELVGDAGTPRFWLSGAGLLLVQYGIFVLGRAVMRLNRARFRYPAPAEIELEQEPGHLVVSEAGKRRTVPFEEIGVLLPTAHHLFIAAGRDLIIVPAEAFPSAGDMAALVADIDTFMREKYAAEAQAAPVVEDEPAPP